MAFDKQKYDREYVKCNYKRHSVLIKPDLEQYIEEYCKYNGMSFNEFFTNAAKYIIGEKIDIKNYKKELLP